MMYWCLAEESCCFNKLNETLDAEQYDRLLLGNSFAVAQLQAGIVDFASQGPKVDTAASTQKEENLEEPASGDVQEEKVQETVKDDPSIAQPLSESAKPDTDQSTASKEAPKSEEEPAGDPKNIQAEDPAPVREVYSSFSL